MTNQLGEVKQVNVDKSGLSHFVSVARASYLSCDAPRSHTHTLCSFYLILATCLRHSTNYLSHPTLPLDLSNNLVSFLQWLNFVAGSFLYQLEQVASVFLVGWQTWRILDTHIHPLSVSTGHDDDDDDDGKLSALTNRARLAPELWSLCKWACVDLCGWWCFVLVKWLTCFLGCDGKKIAPPLLATCGVYKT